ncbi:Alpha/Beta hydrolase protein [Sordaria brevicollis]|uniref:Alpha/Beta hydrolase protein n=1 Tax=Sordaria brevicollis TaxID=83679 RepID=A0AAE0PGN3_SORBR|nr:Alpha/Beta hydrolase protein [Sordaria brevicollis]
MTADEPPSESLTLWEKLSLIWLFPLFAIRLLTFLLLHRNPTLHPLQNLALAYLKLSRATFSAKYLHLQARRTPTGRAIASYLSSKHPNIAYTTVTVPLPESPGLKLRGLPEPVLHILTPLPIEGEGATGRDDGTTLLYLHGGGYVNPLRATGHMPFILSLSQSLSRSSRSSSSSGATCTTTRTIILEYALSPEYPYPSQLIQAAATLSYLLSPSSALGQLNPSNIILAGDSAGGQLVGALLAHLAHPSPYAPPVQGWKEGEDQFKAAVFISPWASMQREGDVIEADDKWDYLSRNQGGRFQELWAPRVDEVWANLCGFSSDAGEQEEVWGRVFGRKGGHKAMVGKTLVTVGTAEVLLDSCRRFGRECVRGKTVVVDRSSDLEREVKGKDVLMVECVGEAHVQPALDAALGYKDGVMMRAILAWLGGV